MINRKDGGLFVGSFKNTESCSDLSVSSDEIEFDLADSGNEFKVPETSAKVLKSQSIAIIGNPTMETNDISEVDIAQDE